MHSSRPLTGSLNSSFNLITVMCVMSWAEVIFTTMPSIFVLTSAAIGRPDCGEDDLDLGYP